MGWDGEHVRVDSGYGIPITEGLSWGTAMTQMALGPVGGSGRQQLNLTGFQRLNGGPVEVVSSLSVEECKHSDDHQVGCCTGTSSRGY